MNLLCIDCGIKISFGHKRCKKCSKSGNNHRLYGKHHSEETKRKISNKLTGRKIPLEIVEKIKKSISGENHYGYIDGRSLTNHFCIECGSLTSGYRAKKCKVCSDKEHGEYMILSNNPNWQGGKSFEPYPLGWNKTFKEQIRFRDGYRCQMCGVSETECSRKLSVHHKDCNKENLVIDNLISLCAHCHIREHKRLEREITNSARGDSQENVMAALRCEESLKPRAVIIGQMERAI